MFSDFIKEGFVLECKYIQKKLESFKNMGLSIILIGQKSAIDWVSNLGFSLYMSLLYYKGLEFFTLDKEYQIIEKRKRNIKTGAKYKSEAKRS